MNPLRTLHSSSSNLGGLAAGQQTGTGHAHRSAPHAPGATAPRTARRDPRRRRVVGGSTVGVLLALATQHRPCQPPPRCLETTRTHCYHEGYPGPVVTCNSNPLAPPINKYMSGSRYLALYADWGVCERRGLVRNDPIGRLPRLGCQTVPQGPGYPCELAFVIPASHPAVSRYARAWKSLETLEVLISSKTVTLRPSR